jgi:hypothetical protein
LTSFKIFAVNPPIASYVFSIINPNTKIYVPDQAVTAYKTSTSWKVYADYIYPISELA